MISFSLQSGSNGNSIYVEAGGTGLLFDAGIAAREAEERLRAHGREIRAVRGLFISHEHSDHVRCAGAWHRKFGLPLYITRPALEASGDLGRLGDVRTFRSGDVVEVDGVKVHTVRTPHDGVDAVAFVVEHEGKRLGILTDLGHPFRGLDSILAGLDAVYLESNYDPHLLESGPYAPSLKARIKGGRGHLSNLQSALLARACLGRLRWMAIAHLSEENNRPEIALAVHRHHLGDGFPLHLASRHAAGPLLDL